METGGIDGCCAADADAGTRSYDTVRVLYLLRARASRLSPANRQLSS